MMDDDRQPPPFVGLMLVSATDSMSVPGNKSARREQHGEESVGAQSFSWATQPTQELGIRVISSVGCQRLPS